MGSRNEPPETAAVCPLTGRAHRAFWLRSAWWCADCKQKLVTCCE